MKPLPVTVFGHVSFMKTSLAEMSLSSPSETGIDARTFRSSPSPFERAPDVWCVSRHQVSRSRSNNTIIFIFPFHYDIDILKDCIFICIYNLMVMLRKRNTFLVTCGAELVNCNAEKWTRWRASRVGCRVSSVFLSYTLNVTENQLLH